MGDLSLNGAPIAVSEDAVLETRKCVGGIKAKQVVYLDSGTNKYGLATATGPVKQRLARGLALHDASDDQDLQIVKGGDVNYGVTLEAGALFFLSSTPGAITTDVPDGPVCLIAMTKSRSKMTLDIHMTSVSD